MQFKLKTLQLLAFLSISQAATAEIYWHGVGTEDKKIKTPSELCNYYAEQRKMDSYERPEAGGQIAITEIRTKYVSSKTRDCRFDYIYISGPSAGTENYGKLRLYRRGDCSPLDTYSHATGAKKGDRFIFPTLILASIYISHSHCIPLPILLTLNHVKRIVQ
ncbi:hypothetical protein [Pseudomonas aeruginosa]|uniref:hypothetical protein n=1 Tax=Pseudomonas aeruginosa TaxID=287 RepID=UPI00300DAF2F